MRKGKEDNKKASASAHFSTRTRGVSVASQHAACLLTVRDECGKASVRHQFWTVLVTGDLCWHAFTYFSLVDSGHRGSVLARIHYFLTSGLI